MKVSLNWLSDYIKKPIDQFKLEENYNLKSQEVAGLYPLVDAKKLVIGYVESCVQHDNADKLKVCQVNVGDEQLQIICGAPNVDADQKVIVALPGAVLPGNFKIKKAKIRGVVSNGMICSLDELGVQDFDKTEQGIYVLDRDAKPGDDPLEYMGLDDWVLDLDLTANRPDLLSMRGVAYDVKAMLDVDISFHQPMVERTSSKADLVISTETDDAPMYYGQLIKNIKVKDSPYWLKARLLSAGVRPINNVVDITNYVMLEYAQPLHAFDYNKINSNTIRVRKANENEVILTLDEVERKLLTSDIVITDGEKPIALAGVMGGLETEVDHTTTTILLESAIFDPVSVRKTSKRLALKSESSSRFEKGINHRLTKEALDRACELFVKFADGFLEGEPSYYNQIKDHKQVITLSLEKLNQVTGHDFTDDIVKDLLRRLDFSYESKPGEYRINVPSRRIGFESYQDIIEEIVRIYGYNQIGVTLPETPTEGKLSQKQVFKRNIRNFFAQKGFFETYTYSLTSLEKAVQYDLKDFETVKIMNPITQEREYLRHSTIPALTEVLTYNVARKIDDVFLFEMGKCYQKDQERELISGLLHGKYQHSLWQKDNNEADFYLMKGLLENLFNTFNIQDVDVKLPSETRVNLHPGIAAELYIGQHKLGWMGKLHPKAEKNIDVSNVFVFELSLDVLYNAYAL
ncbi:MAG TPA: phenylalanine--tRNA ligase subunit beta, partial [Candidatus Izemoplasmatales bacterium]|nr:phenylalanine--tRNA ligase subunit beta [Candidatus Izemoplasmatales bacterium]